METKETLFFILGVFLIILIIGMLVKIYYVVEQHGLQISVLLKHEKEGFVPWRNQALQRNMSSAYRNNLLATDKQLEPKNDGMYNVNNQRAQQPSYALTTEQLNRYTIKRKTDGLAHHNENANALNISVEDSLKTGNLSTADVNVKTNYVETEGAAIDQTGIIQEPVSSEGSEAPLSTYSGNPRTVPAVLGSMTEGFKQANQNSKKRFRETHRGQARPL